MSVVLRLRKSELDIKRLTRMDDDKYGQTLPAELKEEISSPEKLRVEFKESYAVSKEIQETMISFANAVGGRIYIGVREISNESGVRIGEIIGVESPSISRALSNARQWAISFRPKISISFASYQEGPYRVDIIEVQESNQKPVGSSSGLYKIRSSDGNTGIDPALLRQMIVGYESFKSALKLECTENLVLLGAIQGQANAAKPGANLNELSYSTIDIILTNGTLSLFFDISTLLKIRRLCIHVNKLLNFAVTAGGVVITAKTFYDKIVETCPSLRMQIKNLLLKLS